MAYASGTASDYKDLLSKMVTFATANGWVALEQSETQVILKGAGVSGLDEIYVGIATYEDSGNSRYNWKMYSMFGYRAGRTIDKHPRSDGPVVGYFWNDDMNYWLVVTASRIILCAKVSTTYQMVHLGFINTPATEAQYPYPLLIGGGGYILTQNYSAPPFTFWNNGGSYTSRLVLPSGKMGLHNYGTWGVDYEPFSITTINVVNVSLTRPAIDGTYMLEPFYVIQDSGNIFGTIDGLYRVTGYNQTAENIITVEGVNYMVFQDSNRTSYADYCALRLN
jgi:hypothetical protein